MPTALSASHGERYATTRFAHAIALRRHDFPAEYQGIAGGSGGLWIT
jgi:hypothetical protein